jgi:hypothetical protein
MAIPTEPKAMATQAAIGILLGSDPAAARRRGGKAVATRAPSPAPARPHLAPRVIVQPGREALAYRTALLPIRRGPQPCGEQTNQDGEENARERSKYRGVHGFGNDLSDARGEHKD